MGVGQLLLDSRVMVVQTHMCRFGTERRVGQDPNVKGPVRTPTGFMASSWCVRDELDNRCSIDLGHTYAPLVEGRAPAA